MEQTPAQAGTREEVKKKISLVMIMFNSQVSLVRQQESYDVVVLWLEQSTSDLTPNFLCSKIQKLCNTWDKSRSIKKIEFENRFTNTLYMEIMSRDISHFSNPNLTFMCCRGSNSCQQHPGSLSSKNQAPILSHFYNLVSTSLLLVHLLQLLESN